MKFWYYFLHWTWALPINIVGAIVFLVCKMCKCPSYKFRNGYYVVVPQSFGGLEMGMFFIIGKGCESCIEHEYGHSIQMLWWGLLFAPVIGGPSAARYWIREQKTQKGKIKWVISLYAIILLGCVLVSIVALWAPWLFIIPAIALIYGSILCGWLLWGEIPKYKEKYPRYDDIWFEGQATALGEAANQNKWNWL